MREKGIYVRYIATKANNKSLITIARFLSAKVRDLIFTANKQRFKQEFESFQIYLNFDLTKVKREELNYAC